MTFILYFQRRRSMGIKQLLPFVKKACREGNILELKGCSVAIDVSCLLHKGLFGCMEQFAQGQDTKFYLYYVKKYVQYLLEIGCHVIMVFDGRPLPAKKDTNDERRQRRQENMKAGEVLLSQGKKEEAVAKFQQAVSITQEIVDNTIEFFRKMKNVDVIVSPYESDAQLAFLTKEGLADAVITEDSDLIAFGCKKIVFKWNGDKADCMIYDRRLLPECFPGEMRTKFDFDKFRRICILSGCDYLQNGLPGIGLQKAQKFFMKTSQTELRQVLPRIPSYLNEKKLKVTEQFIEEFIRAENTFLYQVVFDPKQRCQRPLHAYPLAKKAKESLDDDDDFVQRPSKKPADKHEYHYAGSVTTASVSVRLALGNSADSGQLNDKFLLPTAIPEWSVWSDTFESGGKKREKKEAEEKRKQKSCGVFVLDSPTKKRKRPAVDDEIFLGDTPEKTAKPPIKSPVVKKKLPAAKRLRNEPDQRESIEELMRIYCPEPAEGTIDGTEDSASSKSSSSTENHQPHDSFKVAVLETASQSSSVISDITVPTDLSQYATPTSTPTLSQQENELPEPKKAATFPIDVSRSVAKAALGVKTLGKSPYFMGRSSGCSNPFKRPSLSQGGSQPTTPASSPAAEKKPKESLLSVIDDDGDSTPSPSRFVNRFAGFKAPGLRRSITK